jgi:hypothetical protein
MKTIAGIFVLSIGLLADGGGGLAHVRPATLEGWTRYVDAVERRRAGELDRSDRFLTMDFGAPEGRRSAMAGALVVSRMNVRDAAGREIEIADGMVHHWQGAVLLPGANLDALMQKLQTEAPPPSPEVLRASVLSRGPASLKVHLRLKRTKIVTVVYDTEHDVTFARHGNRRASSRSVASRIVELENPGTPDERPMADGDDSGFLWRLNAYWRYEAVSGGVLAECESISLSRGIPFGLGVIAGPIVSSTARESMERTLESLRSMAGAS